MDGEIYSVEEMRELGKHYFFNSEGDKEKKEEGFRLIFRAHRQGDAEARFIVARLLLDGVLEYCDPMPAEEQALILMCSSANSGFIQARAYLNAYCEGRYRKKFGFLKKSSPAGLTDLEGKPITIDRRGIFTPIDVLLEHKDDRSILTLSVNLNYLLSGDEPWAEGFVCAVREGVLAWEGDYEVFGGQPLTLKIELTEDQRAFDTVTVVPVTDEFNTVFKRVGNAVGTKKSKAVVNSVVDHRRSFATNGFKWSVHSRKLIFIQSKDGSFCDLEEIKHTVKHEFGHCLGLGDLYSSTVDEYSGVELGTFDELDSYAITDKIYNLVMCDHHGPISNNDIEMIILAFRDNRIQNYQANKTTKRVSSALGKGN